MTAEYFARECRKAPACADLAERAGQIELADAAGAVAANKLSQALRVAERYETVVHFPIDIRAKRLPMGIIWNDDEQH